MGLINDGVSTVPVSGPPSVTVSHGFLCEQAGVSDVGVVFTVGNIGAGYVLFSALGLERVQAEIKLTTNVTCVAEASPPRS